MTARYFDVIFASAGDLTTVPDGVQGDGSVSYTQGYPIKYSTPVSLGGIDIERGKMNQLFNDITGVLQQLQQNGVPLYYSAISGAAGYAKYALVLYSDGIVYQSQINANADTPGASVNWVAFPLGIFSGFTTGDAKITLKNTADTGWILADDGTIGNAASGGTTRANADTVALFTLLWTNVSNTYCAVSGGRGASAAADYAANKTIAIPKALGRALMLAGSGSGLTARSLGQTLGEETHILVTGELASHSHTATVTDPTHSHSVLGDSGIASNAQGLSVSGTTSLMGSDTAAAYVRNIPAGGTPFVQASATGISVSNANTGSGTGHNNMQPSTCVNFMIKL